MQRHCDVPPPRTFSFVNMENMTTPPETTLLSNNECDSLTGRSSIRHRHRSFRTRCFAVAVEHEEVQHVLDALHLALDADVPLHFLAQITELVQVRLQYHPEQNENDVYLALVRWTQ